jgi:hypothetical protein
VATCFTYKSSSHQKQQTKPVNLIGGYVLHLQKLFTSKPTKQTSESYWWLRASPTKALHIKKQQTKPVNLIGGYVLHLQKLFTSKTTNQP